MPRNIQKINAKAYQNIPKLGFFGMEIYHLATVPQSIHEYKTNQV
jgi:hypothetical protein